MPKVDRIDYNDDGVDDVVLWDIETFRLERMTDNSFWIRLYRKDKNKRDVVFRVGSFDIEGLPKDREPNEGDFIRAMGTHGTKITITMEED